MYIFFTFEKIKYQEDLAIVYPDLYSVLCCLCVVSVDLNLSNRNMLYSLENSEKITNSE